MRLFGGSAAVCVVIIIRVCILIIIIVWCNLLCNNVFIDVHSSL